MFIRFLKRYPFSSLAVVLITLLLLNQSYKVGTWRNNRSIIHDITSYYSYLPAAFIYDDFEFNYRYELPQDEPRDHVWVNTRGDSVFQKMSVGLSYFYFPTFIAAHWYTKTYTDFNANGFSKPYQMALNMNTLIFGLMGLLVCWLICLKLFDDKVSAVTLLLLYAGTNLLYYVTGAPGLSHPYSLLLVALMYLITIYYFQKPKRLYLILLALIIGLVTLVRPTNAILCLFPLLYGLSKTNRATLFKILSKPTNYLLFIVGFIIPWIPQFMYWYYATGQVFFYSYDQEGFFFNKAHVIDGLFSYRKGWLVYTPLMILALLGVFFSKRHKNLRWPLLIILPLFVFVVFSWWCWWYGGSFGSRVMVETYPLLLVGLGAFISYTMKSRWYIRIPLIGVVLFTVVLNLNQVFQYNIGMLHWDSMTKDAYWSIFLQDTPPDNFQELIEAPDYKRAMKEGE